MYRSYKKFKKRLFAFFLLCLTSGVAGAQQILTTGDTNTTVNVNGSLTTVSTTTINNSNAFNSFSRFNTIAGNNVNMIIPDSANRLINVIKNETSYIRSNVNAIKNGTVGGDIYFLNPYGFSIEAGGKINADSITLVTPTTQYINSFFTSPGLPATNSVNQLINGTAPTSTTAMINNAGTINARQNINFQSQNITNSGYLYTDADFDDSFIDLGMVINFNTMGVTSANYLSLENGEIKLKASNNINNTGEIVGGRTISFEAGNINNNSSGIIYGGHDIIVRSNNISNSSTINSRGKVDLQATGNLIVNPAGLVNSGTEILMTANNMTINGQVIATGYYNRNYNYLYIYADGTISPLSTINAQLINNVYIPEEIIMGTGGKVKLQATAIGGTGQVLAYDGYGQALIENLSNLPLTIANDIGVKHIAPSQIDINGTIITGDMDLIYGNLQVRSGGGELFSTTLLGPYGDNTSTLNINSDIIGSLSASDFNAINVNHDILSNGGDISLFANNNIYIAFNRLISTRNMGNRPNANHYIDPSMGDQFNILIFAPEVFFAQGASLLAFSTGNYLPGDIEIDSSIRFSSYENTFKTNGEFILNYDTTANNEGFSLNSTSIEASSIKSNIFIPGQPINITSEGFISLAGLDLIKIANQSFVPTGLNLTAEDISLTGDFNINGNINLNSQYSISIYPEGYAEPPVANINAAGNINLSSLIYTNVSTYVDLNAGNDININGGDVFLYGNASGQNILINPSNKLGLNNTNINASKKLTLNSGNVAEFGMIYKPDSISCATYQSDFLNNNQPLNLTGQAFDINGSIFPAVAGNNIKPSSLSLTNTGSQYCRVIDINLNGPVIINSPDSGATILNINSSSDVTINAKESIYVDYYPIPPVQYIPNAITARNIVLNSTSGNIGSTLVPVKFNTINGTLSAQANGSVYLANGTSNISVNLLESKTSSVLLVSDASILDASLTETPNFIGTDVYLHSMYGSLGTFDNDIDLKASGKITANAYGLVNVSQTGNLNIASVGSALSDVILNSSGSILDFNNDAFSDITGNNIYLAAMSPGSTIGTATNYLDLNSALGSLIVLSYGQVNIRETSGDLKINVISNVGRDNVNISADGSILDGSPLWQEPNIYAKNILLISDKGSIGTLIDDFNIISNYQINGGTAGAHANGSINLTQNSGNLWLTDVSCPGDVILTSAAGIIGTQDLLPDIRGKNITFNAIQNSSVGLYGDPVDIDTTGGTLTVWGYSFININEIAGNLPVNIISNAGRDNIQIASAGSILDASTDEGANVYSKGIFLNAVNNGSIGTYADDFDIDTCYNNTTGTIIAFANTLINLYETSGPMMIDVVSNAGRENVLLSSEGGILDASSWENPNVYAKGVALNSPKGSIGNVNDDIDIISNYNTTGGIVSSSSNTSYINISQVTGSLNVFDVHTAGDIRLSAAAGIYNGGTGSIIISGKNVTLLAPGGIGKSTKYVTVGYKGQAAILAPQPQYITKTLIH